jgi:hypothetical protein
MQGIQPQPVTPVFQDGFCLLSQRRCYPSIDILVKSPFLRVSVIPAKAGIQ